jgi:predicted ATP-dependent serine protease
LVLALAGACHHCGHASLAIGCQAPAASEWNLPAERYQIRKQEEERIRGERERKAERHTTMKMEMRTQVSRDTEAVGLDEGFVRLSYKPYFFS